MKGLAALIEDFPAAAEVSHNTPRRNARLPGLQVQGRSLQRTTRKSRQQGTSTRQALPKARKSALHQALESVAAFIQFRAFFT